MAASAIHTWSNRKLEPYQYPERALTIAVALGASLNLPRGTVLGQKTADGKYYAYNGAAADGTETAKAILAYDVQTDANGNVTFSGSAGQSGGEHGQKHLSAPAYVAGYFKTDELVGLDAAGMADMAGNLISGTVASGVLRIG